MRPASRDELDGDAWRIYDYVVRHFIATVAQNCKYQSTTIYFKIGEETFSFSGKKLLDPGQVPFFLCGGDDAISVPP